MSKHSKDHPRIRTRYGFVGSHRETRTRLVEPTTPDDYGRPIRYGELIEPQPSGPRPIVRQDETIADRESFDHDGERYRDEHKP